MKNQMVHIAIYEQNQELVELYKRMLGQFFNLKIYVNPCGEHINPSYIARFDLVIVEIHLFDGDLRDYFDPFSFHNTIVVTGDREYLDSLNGNSNRALLKPFDMLQLLQLVQKIIVA